MARCKACGKEFKKPYNSAKYCCDECREVALRQQWRNASHKHYHKHKNEWGSRSVRRYGMGTGTLGPHAKDDHEDEHVTIVKELKRLRIKI